MSNVIGKGAVAMKNISIILLSALFMVSCKNVPSQIEVAPTQVLTTFESVSADKSSSVGIGSKARWGGKIVAVENKKDVSEIEVVYFPENSSGKPRIGQPSIGRFKAIVDGFVDPVVFEPGRLITVVGEIGEVQSGLIGEQEYQYPSLNAMGYYMWKETQDVQVDGYRFSPFAFHAGYNHAFYSPWYDPYWHSPQRVRVRVVKNDGHNQGAVVKPAARVVNNSEASKNNRPSKTKVNQPSQKEPQ